MFNNLFLKILIIFISIVDYFNKKKIIFYFKDKTNNDALNIIDIGAHKGETIDLFINNLNVKRIYSFEPNISLFTKLKSKKKLDNRVHLFNYGVGLIEKEDYLNIMEETSSSTFHNLNYQSDYYKRKKKIVSFLSKKDLIQKKQKIKIVNLSSFIIKKKIMTIDILKIDTEGYEYNILKGLKKNDFKKIKFVYFEHHYDMMINKGYKFSEINDLLVKNCFKKKYKLKMNFRKVFEYIYENSP